MQGVCVWAVNPCLTAAQLAALRAQSCRRAGRPAVLQLPAERRAVASFAVATTVAATALAATSIPATSCSATATLDAPTFPASKPGVSRWCIPADAAAAPVCRRCCRCSYLSLSLPENPSHMVLPLRSHRPTLLPRRQHRPLPHHHHYRRRRFPASSRRRQSRSATVRARWTRLCRARRRATPAAKTWRWRRRPARALRTLCTQVGMRRDHSVRLAAPEPTTPALDRLGRGPSGFAAQQLQLVLVDDGLIE